MGKTHQIKTQPVCAITEQSKTDETISNAERKWEFDPDTKKFVGRIKCSAVNMED